jgi:hypothetical protein
MQTFVFLKMKTTGAEADGVSPEARRLLPPELFDTLVGNSEQSTTEGKESSPPHQSKAKSNSE